MYASNPHSYTHLILALVIVREPTIWVFITLKYPGIHDIGLPSGNDLGAACGDEHAHAYVCGRLGAVSVSGGLRLSPTWKKSKRGNAGVPHAQTHARQANVMYA